MATYDEWNEAIAEYFVRGVSSGSTIYLSVDEETLMDIGFGFKQSEIDNVNWVEDFKKAVQNRWVIGDKVNLPYVSDVQPDKIPLCVAFLAAMVLAAHYMISEEDENITISSRNYFKRFRQVFGISDEKTGRPLGINQTGIEEDLWIAWNLWLIGNGWLHSAEQGKPGTNKYINYPLSQALLREADLQELEHLFRENEKQGELSRFSDKDAIGSWVRKQDFVSSHLTDLIHESDFRRYEAVTDAVFDLYSAIDWEQLVDSNKGKRPISKGRMIAELYRVEDVILGDIKYYLYPRQPKQFNGESMEVVINGNVHHLQEERQGWFSPLLPVEPDGGVSYEVRGHAKIRELIIPRRKFWIFVQDPENDTSGVFAGWKKPGLGEYFILLCRTEYIHQMIAFEQQDLIKWDDDFSINKEWVEFQGCKINTLSWENIVPEYPDLYEALKPRISATISLKGGLRVPNQSGWLEGYLPKITVFAFDDSVRLKLANNSSPDELVMDQKVNTNKLLCIPSLDPGVYLFEVYSSEKIVARRSLQVLPWDSLECPQPKQPFTVNIGKFIQQGAVIRINETNDNKER